MFLSLCQGLEIGTRQWWDIMLGNLQFQFLNEHYKASAREDSDYLYYYPPASGQTHVHNVANWPKREDKQLLTLLFDAARLVQKIILWPGVILVSETSKLTHESGDWRYQHSQLILQPPSRTTCLWWKLREKRTENNLPLPRRGVAVIRTVHGHEGITRLWFIFGFDQCFSFGWKRWGIVYGDVYTQTERKRTLTGRNLYTHAYHARREDLDRSE